MIFDPKKPPRYDRQHHRLRSHVDVSKSNPSDRDHLEFDGTLREWGPVPRSVPVGAVMAWPDSTAPNGFLILNGATHAQSDYPDLWDWGNPTTGNGFLTDAGAGNFTLPDLRGYMIIGAGGTPALAVGATAGAWDHVHSGPSHSHTNPSTSITGDHLHTNPNTANAGDHIHTQANTGGTSLSTDGPSSTITVEAGTTRTVARDTHSHTDAAHLHTNPNTATNGDHSHTQGNTGATGDHSHTQGDTGLSGTANTGVANPPVFAMNWIIKT